MCIDILNLIIDGTSLYIVSLCLNLFAYLFER